MVEKYYCCLLSLVIQISRTFGSTKNIGNKFTDINTARGSGSIAPIAPTPATFRDATAV